MRGSSVPFFCFFRKPLQIDSTNLVSTYHSASYAGCNYKKTETCSSGSVIQDTEFLLIRISLKNLAALKMTFS